MSRLGPIAPGHFVRTDGGWGTALQALGLPLGLPSDRWNIERPDAVAEVARRFVDAGAEILLTNTFQPLAAARGDVAQAVKLIRQGVAISRSAAPSGVRVFGSLGPLAGNGNYLPLGEALAEAGADAIVLETFSDPENTRRALRALQPLGLPLVLSITLGFGPLGDESPSGMTPEQAATLAHDEGADAIGTNCGDGLRGLATIIRRFRSAAPLPVWIKPNAGLPTLQSGRAVYPVGPEEFGSQLREWLDAGAQFIGGCCGVSPVHLQALSQGLAQATRPRI